MKKPSTARFAMLILLGSHGAALLAQSDVTLLARSAKNTVLTEIDPESKCLRFLSNRTDVDDIQWEFTTKEEKEPLFLVKDNTYNIRMRLNNPLKYRISVEGKVYEEDTYDKTINDLADAFQSLLTTVTRGGANLGTLNSGDALRQSPAAFDPGKSVTISPKEIQLTKPGVEDNIEPIRDYGIRQAILVAYTLNDSDDWATSDGWDDIDLSVNDQDGGWDDPWGTQGQQNKEKQKTDKSPFHPEPWHSLTWLIEAVTDSVKEIEKAATNEVLTISASVIRDLITLDLGTSGAARKADILDTMIKGLDDKNSTLATRINALAKIQEKDILKRRLKARGDNILPDADLSRIAEDSEGPTSIRRTKSRAILQLGLRDYAVRMTIYLNQRQRLVTNLKELMKVVRSAQDMGSKTERNTELLHSAVIPKGSTEVVTVSIKERTFKVENDYTVKIIESDEPMITHKLRFMRAHLFYPQGFPAAVFINDVFPEYTAQEDSLGLFRVGAKENSQGYFNIAAMVNFNIKMDRKTEVPFLQIGASAKKSKPQAFVGAGIRLTEWFCVSMGAAMTWQASLGDLAIGDKVANQDAIDKDLRYRMSDPKFYFSVQLRPSTLTKKP